MNRSEQEIWREALRATSLGWDLALPIFGGVLIGYVLDRALGTKYVFTLVLLVLGIAIGFYNVIRSIRRLDEQSCRRASKQGEESDEETKATR